MNEQNYDYLKNQVKYTGFGEGLENQLKEKMVQGEPAFTIRHNTEFGNDKMTSDLHFRKSDQTDMYFFNKYDTSLKKGNEDTEMKQTFYIGKENNITLKEAYNLMDGRSVNKDLVNREGEKYNAWVQLNFKETDSNGNFKPKQFHENYGFDLEKALEQHPIKELSSPEDKERLMDSLKKGNRQSVTFKDGDDEQKRFVEASPQFKSINVYDQSQNRIGRSNNQKESQSKSESKGMKEGAANDSGDGDGAKVKSRKKVKVS